MADLVIRISGDVKSYDEALEQAQNQTQALTDKVTEIGKFAAVAFAALTAEIGISTAAYKESQQAVNKLEQALKNQGLSSKAVSEAYQEQASALQKLTGISDEVIIRSQTTLQSFLGQKQVTQELTQAVLDFSAAKGIDAESASQLFGKAIDGNTAMLKRYGIEIEEGLTRQQRLDEIIKKVSGSFGGQAEAAAQGLGALNRLKETVNDLQEKIGERFAPAIEAVSNKLIHFFELIQNNPALITFISTVIAGGAALAAFVSGLAAVTVGFLAASAAASALGVTVGVLLGPVTLLAAGFVAAAAAFGYFATKQKEVVNNADATAKKISDLREEIEKLQAVQDRDPKFSATTNIAKNIEAKKNEISRLEELQEKQAQGELQRETSKNTLLNEESKKAADKRAADQDRIDQLAIRATKLKNEIIKLENENASTEYIKAKQDELATIQQLESEQSATTRALLEEKLATQKALTEEARQSEFDASNDFNNQILEQNAEYQALDDQQKQAFRDKNEASLKSQLLNENTARQQAALDRSNIQVKEHNTFLLNQQKFGTAYATINQVMNSTIVQGTAKAFGELTQLQTSNNATLKSIGKVAAIADITIKTAQSAVNIYNGFSTIPFIGPALGVAGAAAAIAFGVEKIGQVNAAAEGGLLTGGIPGVDSIPVLAQHGELIAPRQNFDEVVDSVADKRNAERGNPTGSGGGGSEEISITLELKDTLMDFIDIQNIKRRKLGTSLAG